MGSHLTTETQRHRAFVWKRKTLCLCASVVESKKENALR